MPSRQLETLRAHLARMHKEGAGEDLRAGFEEKARRLLQSVPPWEQEQARDELGAAQVDLPEPVGLAARLERDPTEDEELRAAIDGLTDSLSALTRRVVLLEGAAEVPGRLVDMLEEIARILRDKEERELGR